MELDDSLVEETNSYVYFGRSINMENNMTEELDRRRRAAWAAFGPLKEATDQLTDPTLRAHLFDSTVLPALCYAAETWADTSTTSRMLRTTHRALERCLLRFNRHSQRLAGLRSSEMRQLSHIRDAETYTSLAKHRWAGHIVRRTDDRWTKRAVDWTPRGYTRPRGRPPIRWADVFVKRIKQAYSQLLLPQSHRHRYETRSSRHVQIKPPPWTTIARRRDEWKMCWGPHNL